MNHPQLGSFEFTATGQTSLEPNDIREIELSFAYEHAAGLIEMHCLLAEACDVVGGTPWYDLATRDEDLTDEVKYLLSRNLIEIHPTERSWVRICDESEPLIETVN